MVGIGGAARTLGQLRKVPVHIGTGSVNPDAVVTTTFYVLDSDHQYSLILGREFLAAVQGVVNVPCHLLQYTTAAGT